MGGTYDISLRHIRLSLERRDTVPTGHGGSHRTALSTLRFATLPASLHRRRSPPLTLKRLASPLAGMRAWDLCWISLGLGSGRGLLECHPSVVIPVSLHALARLVPSRRDHRRRPCRPDGR